MIMIMEGSDYSLIPRGNVAQDIGMTRELWALGRLSFQLSHYSLTSVDFPGALNIQKVCLWLLQLLLSIAATSGL